MWHIPGRILDKEPKRRRTLIIGVTIVCAGLLSCIPYSTQVAPAIRLTLVDDQGKPVGDIDGRYSFTNYPEYDYIETEFHVPHDGKIELDRHWCRMSFISRVAHDALWYLVPVLANSVGADVKLMIPRIYQVDEPAAEGPSHDHQYDSTLRTWIGRNGLAYSTAVYDEPKPTYELMVDLWGSWPSRWQKMDLVVHLRRASEKIPEPPRAQEAKSRGIPGT
jgi:hypothetical protein